MMRSVVHSPHGWPNVAPETAVPLALIHPAENIAALSCPAVSAGEPRQFRHRRPVPRLVPCRQLGEDATGAPGKTHVAHGVGELRGIVRQWAGSGGGRFCGGGGGGGGVSFPRSAVRGGG